MINSREGQKRYRQREKSGSFPEIAVKKKKKNQMENRENLFQVRNIEDKIFTWLVVSCSKDKRQQELMTGDKEWGERAVFIYLIL